MGLLSYMKWMIPGYGSGCCWVDGYIVQLLDLCDQVPGDRPLAFEIEVEPHVRGLGFRFKD